MILCQIKYQTKLKEQYAFHDIKALIDADNKLLDFMTLKNDINNIIINNDGKFYPQISLEEAFNNE